MSVDDLRGRRLILDQMPAGSRAGRAIYPSSYGGRGRKAVQNILSEATAPGRFCPLLHSPISGVRGWKLIRRRLLH